MLSTPEEIVSSEALPPSTMEYASHEQAGVNSGQLQSEPSSPLLQTPSFTPLNASTSTISFKPADPITHQSSSDINTHTNEPPPRPLTKSPIHINKLPHTEQPEDLATTKIQQQQPNQQGFTTPWGKTAFQNPTSNHPIQTLNLNSSSSMTATKQTATTSNSKPTISFEAPFAQSSSTSTSMTGANQRTRFHSLGSEPTQYHSKFMMQNNYQQYQQQQQLLQQQSVYQVQRSASGYIPQQTDIRNMSDDLMNFMDRLENSKYIFFETPNMIIHNLEASADNSYTVFTFLFPNKPMNSPDVPRRNSCSSNSGNNTYHYQNNNFEGMAQEYNHNEFSQFLSGQMINNIKSSSSTSPFNPVQLNNNNNNNQKNSSFALNPFQLFAQNGQAMNGGQNETTKNSTKEMNNVNSSNNKNNKKQTLSQKRDKSSSISTNESIKGQGRSKSMSNLSMPSMLSQSNINSLLSLTLGIPQPDIQQANKSERDLPLLQGKTNQQSAASKKKKSGSIHCKSSIILDSQIKEEEQDDDERMGEDNDSREQFGEDVDSNNEDCDSRDVCGDQDSNQEDEEARLIREIKEMQAKKKANGGSLFFDAEDAGDTDLFDFCDEKFGGSSGGRKKGTKASSSRKLDGSHQNFSSSNLSSNRHKFDTKNLVKNFLNSFISFVHHPDEEVCVLDVLAFSDSSATAALPIISEDDTQRKCVKVESDVSSAVGIAANTVVESAAMVSEEQGEEMQVKKVENDSQDGGEKQGINGMTITTVVEKLNSFKNGLRNFFKGKKFNRVLLKDFIFEDEFRPLFVYFLENRALTWIESGRMKDKASHLRALKNFIFVCQNHDQIKSWRFRYNFVQN